MTLDEAKQKLAGLESESAARGVALPPWAVLLAEVVGAVVDKLLAQQP